jgi:hypothetical protein
MLSLHWDTILTCLDLLICETHHHGVFHSNTKFAAFALCSFLSFVTHSVQTEDDNTHFSSGDEDDHNENDGNKRSGFGTNRSPLFEAADFEADDSFLDDEDEQNHQPRSLHAAVLPPPLGLSLEEHHARANNICSTPAQPKTNSGRPPLNPAHKKKTKSRKSQVSPDEEDDHRPDSDRVVLQPLQQAKYQQRLKNRHHQQDKMNEGTRLATKKRNAKAAQLPTDGGKNLGQVGKTNTVPRKNSATNARDLDSASPSVVSQQGQDDDNDDRPNAPPPALEPRSQLRDEDDNIPSDRKEAPNAQKNAPSARKELSADERLKKWTKLAERTPEDMEEELRNQKRKDAKVPRENRLALIANLRKTIATLRLARAKDQVYIASQDSTVKELELEKTMRISKSKAQKLKLCAEIQSKVEEVTKSYLWRTTKFMTCQEDLDTGVEKVIAHGKFCDGMSVQLKDSFGITYAAVIKKAINTARNYLTQELKKIAFKDFLEKGLPLPGVDVLLACAMRQIPEDNKPKFKLYWTKFLRTLVEAKVWAKDIFYYTTILKARMDPSNPKSLRLFTVSHEAMICLVWENNWQKWQDQYNFTQVPANKGKKQPTLPGKWTRSDAGQSEWGGWSEEGLKAYNAYKKRIRAGRNGRMDEVCECEETILAELRADVGIEADNHEAQLRLNRAKKRRTNSEAPVPEPKLYRAIATVDEEDEEEEEENQQQMSW